MQARLVSKAGRELDMTTGAMMLSLIFNRIGQKHQPELRTVSAFRTKPLADVASFAAWLAAAGETDFDRRRLLILFAEFCDFDDREPLTERQLLLRAKAAGIERYRLSTGRREWRYRLHSADVVEFAEHRGAA